MYFLLKANHEEKEIDFNGSPLKIERGSFLSSYSIISKDTGLSVQNTRTAMKNLKNHRMIEFSTKELTKQATYITICNYDSYQSDKKESNKGANKVPTKSQQSPNNNERTNKELIRTKKEIKEHFELCWEIYPLRNGKRIGKKNALSSFEKLPIEKQRLVYKSIPLYEKYLNESGISAKDFERYINKETYSEMLENNQDNTSSKAQKQIEDTKRLLDG
jgi:hypothetical protein